MGNYIIVAAIGMALLMTLVFSGTFMNRGGGAGIVIFFLLVFMASWASQLWIRPMGPITSGIAWVPLIFTGSAVAFLLAWTGQATKGTVSPAPKEDDRETRNFFEALGFIFWVLVVIFLAAIVLGYYYPSRIEPIAFLQH